MSGYNVKPTAPPAGDQVYQQQGVGYPPPVYSQQPQAPYPPQPAYPPPPPYAPPSQPAYTQPQLAYPPSQPAYPPQYINNYNQPLLQPAARDSDNYIIGSIIVVIWSFFCGLAYLVCSVPALILTISAKNDERLGDNESAKTKQRLSILLNIFAIVFP